MNVNERLRQIIASLPSDTAAVTLTRADLAALIEGPENMAPIPTRDLSVDEVAQDTGRAPSTVRGWLIAGALRGYKLNGRDWRVTRAALREYLDRQAVEAEGRTKRGHEVDLTVWRGIQSLQGST